MNISVLLEGTATEIKNCDSRGGFCFYLAQFYDSGLKSGISEENMKLHDMPIITINHNNKTKIVVNNAAIEEIYAKCWLNDKISVEILKNAFIINEAVKERYSYIRTSSPDHVADKRYLDYGKNIVFKSIQEVLYQAMCEYRIGIEYPEFARYLAILNAVVKVNPISAVLDDNVLSARLIASGISKESFDYFKLCMKTISDLAKYNSIVNLNDLSFANYSLPLILSAKRCSVFEVIQSSILLYEWLTKASKSQFNMKETCNKINDIFEKELPQNQTAKAKITKPGATHFEVIDEEEMEGIDADLKELNIKGRFEEIAEFLTGLEASTQEANATTEDATQFYLDTIKKYAKKISDLERIFRNAFTTMKLVRAFDGDVNLKMQQQAYLSSITHEDAKVYQYYKKKKISVDVYILRDISGSTAKFKQAYAESIIILLAAIQYIEGIRTMQIDFNKRPFINKSFDRELKSADIGQKAAGGTEIIDTLRLVQRQQQKGKRQLLFIMSDGAFSSVYETNKIFKELTTSGFDIFKMAIGNYRASGFDSVEIAEIDKYIARKILESGVVENG